MIATTCMTEQISVDASFSPLLNVYCLAHKKQEAGEDAFARFLYDGLPYSSTVMLKETFISA
ncbi:MAG: hypothetical protein EOM12_06840, partial [Verrucomicrobiae bacterium]|nr:hypothetical protein [Verrucomicrobiae bacterium]